MSREIIVDMQSPTPFDEYRYKVESNVEIFISRDIVSRKYILEIKENGESKAKIESRCSQCRKRSFLQENNSSHYTRW